MAFLRVMEVLPPLFPRSQTGKSAIQASRALERFVHDVREVGRQADLVLVASVRDQDRLRFDSLHAAVMLQDDLGLEAAAVLVVRDQNRPQLLSSVLTAISLGLNSIMIAWGDDYESGATNVRDFSSLASAISEADRVKSRAGSKMRILAPIDLRSLSRPEGVAMVRERVRAGAEVLLAQPPTADLAMFDQHTSWVEEAGLRDHVLLNVFPFRDKDDIARCEKAFGWKMPASVHEAASGGGARLLAAAGEVVRVLRDRGYPGVYVSTRGDPSIPKRLVSLR